MLDLPTMAKRLAALKSGYMLRYYNGSELLPCPRYIKESENGVNMVTQDGCTILSHVEDILSLLLSQRDGWCKIHKNGTEEEI